MTDLLDLPRSRRLGKTDAHVSTFGRGGEGVLHSWSRSPEAVEIIWRALELGVSFFDCAHAYAGSEDYHGAVWGEHPSLRKRVFLASKSAERTKRNARLELEMTLRRMHVDHLDLWQVQRVAKALHLVPHNSAQFACILHYT